MSRPSRATRAAAALDYAAWLRRRAAEAYDPERRARFVARARVVLSKTQEARRSEAKLEKEMAND